IALLVGEPVCDLDRAVSEGTCDRIAELVRSHGPFELQEQLGHRTPRKTETEQATQEEQGEARVRGEEEPEGRTRDRLGQDVIDEEQDERAERDRAEPQQRPDAASPRFAAAAPAMQEKAENPGKDERVDDAAHV